MLLVCLPKLDHGIPDQPKEKRVADLESPRPFAIPEQSMPQRKTRECPYCAEDILVKAKVCKHCGRDVEPLEIDITR